MYDHNFLPFFELPSSVSRLRGPSRGGGTNGTSVEDVLGASTGNSEPVSGCRATAICGNPGPKFSPAPVAPSHAPVTITASPRNCELLNKTNPHRGVTDSNGTRDTARILRAHRLDELLDSIRTWASATCIERAYWRSTARWQLAEFRRLHTVPERRAFEAAVAASQQTERCDEERCPEPWHWVDEVPYCDTCGLFRAAVARSQHRRTA